MASAERTVLGSQLIARVDTVPFEWETSSLICTRFKQAGFGALDTGHHIAIDTPLASNGAVWEAAVLYIQGKTFWVKALAKRWWLLFTAGDRDQRYEAFWRVIDHDLQPLFDQFRAGGWGIQQGTVGELDIKQAFKDCNNGRDPTSRELAELKAAIDRMGPSLR